MAPTLWGEDLSLAIRDAAEVSMPTEIPVYVERSYASEAVLALMLSLLAATVDGVVFLVIVWAYSS